MGAMKRFAEEVSEIIGKEGEITDQVLEISSKVMEGIDKVKKPYTSDNPEFVKHVMGNLASIAGKCTPDKS